MENIIILPNYLTFTLADIKNNSKHKKESMKKTISIATRSRNCPKRPLRISICSFCFHNLNIAVIIEEESEVDPNEEFEGLDDEIKKSVTKSFFEEPRNKSVASVLSEYNRKATEKGISLASDCTDASQASFCLEKRCPDTESNCSATTSRDCMDSLHPENIEVSDDEGVQKPSPSSIQLQQPFIEKGGKEDIVPTPQAKIVKRINLSVVPKKDNRLERMAAKKAISEAISMREVGKDAKKVINLLKDFKEGPLEKRSNSLLKLWKEKYCRVGNSQFTFYKDLAAGWISGFIDFRRIQCKVAVDKPSMCFIIYMWTGKTYKNFTFRARTEEELQEWAQAVYLNIEKNRPLVLDSSLYSIEKFWKYRTIRHATVLEKADTADLILFSGSRFACKVQRFLTRSRFDHVGMFLRYQDGRLFLLEATNNEGVGLSEWNEETAKDYRDMYRIIVYRQLQYKRTYKLVTKLENFLKNARGKKYQLDPLRLLQKYSSTNSVEDLHENKGYFCSELIASAYKTLGVLPNHIKSAQYWPGTFSAEGKLKLENGARLGDELLIEFET